MQHTDFFMKSKLDNSIVRFPEAYEVKRKLSRYEGITPKISQTVFVDSVYGINEVYHLDLENITFGGEWSIKLHDNEPSLDLISREGSYVFLHFPSKEELEKFLSTASFHGNIMMDDKIEKRRDNLIPQLRHSPSNRVVVLASGASLVMLGLAIISKYAKKHSGIGKLLSAVL